MLFAFILCTSALFGAVISITPGGAYTGNFSHDNDVQQFSFTLDTNASVYFQTYSWASATMTGFTPELTLFTSAGVYLTGGTGSVGFAPDGCGLLTVVAGSCQDAFINTDLLAGDYLLVLTQFGNDPATGLSNNLSDGFTYDDAHLAAVLAATEPGAGCTSADFTGLSDGCKGYGDGQFFDAFGNPLTSAWALSEGDAVPEPTPAFLAFSGLVALASIGKMRAAFARRQQQRSGAEPYQGSLRVPTQDIRRAK